ncbi:hypothetical protein ACEPPN_011039 [Leptodophora sp. 'Broadleaf-Isolate-01']
MVSAAVTYVTTLLAATLTLGRARVVGNEALWGEANAEADLKLGFMRLRWEEEQERRAKPGGMFWLKDEEYLAGEALFLNPTAMKPYMQGYDDFINDDHLAQALNSLHIT